VAQPMRWSVALVPDGVPAVTKMSLKVVVINLSGP